MLFVSHSDLGTCMMMTETKFIGPRYFYSPQVTNFVFPGPTTDACSYISVIVKTFSMVSCYKSRSCSALGYGVWCTYIVIGCTLWFVFCRPCALLALRLSRSLAFFNQNSLYRLKVFTPTATLNTLDTVGLENSIWVVISQMSYRHLFIISPYEFAVSQNNLIQRNQ